MLFFLIMLVKHVYVLDMNCEFELTVLIIYYTFLFLQQKQYYTNRNAISMYLDEFPEEQRSKQRIRLIKSIINNGLQIIFYILLLLYTIRDKYGKRLIPYWAIIIPEVICFIVNLFMSRWPDNPCMSLQHLIESSASVL